MSSIGLIFPDQLSKDNMVLKKASTEDLIIFYEPLESFYEINHHKHKLVFLISAFRHFINIINHKNSLHEKISKNPESSLINYLDSLHKDNAFKNLMVSKPSDFKTLKDLMYFCQSHEVKLEVFDDKKFISTTDDYEAWSEGKKTTIQEYYYRWLRKKFNILMNDKGKPIGDKWNFDKDNRKGVSQLKDEIPKRNKIKTDSLTVEVMIEVEEIFQSSPGNLENFNWVVTHDDAWSLFIEFLDVFLPNYGTFQDAINKDDPFMYHSLLSPYLNSGLLNPLECVKAAEEAYKSSNGAIPINSVEGFIRQILGWREFIMGVYWNNMPQYKGFNFWSHSRDLSDSWYDGSTGIPPLDTAIIESNDYGYTHHINRLMIISNLMNLSGIHPDLIYKWSMEMYIDSADWVMVPNVYGMGTFADGGIFSTKPYICGSSYMLRMSNYKKGEWCDVVDGLYWRFIDRNRKFFLKNPRLSMMVRIFDKMKSDRKKLILSEADKFIKLNTI